MERVKYITKGDHDRLIATLKPLFDGPSHLRSAPAWASASGCRIIIVDGPETPLPPGWGPLKLLNSAPVQYV